MKWVLRTGMHMCIYPEGTRNRTTEPLKPFYSGAFKLAYETKTDIIPALFQVRRKLSPYIKLFSFYLRNWRYVFLSQSLLKIFHHYN
ncbi:1-acyl-sn-glycerol-3-phosphate acyltransferase [Niabella hibiscisoli]|uniref:1-acyl-sn-glycerol-3-phosphate acyltransferase n=1 Tax=Niabella hibiscisoli TaxID=1825928 RepID=UPI00293EB644|nr:1-acyl-sn-glycerol-3-phosphate acyltransferase [Niabella hibiscisoli]